MVSFYVCFLFTNVSLQETIDLISNCVYSKDLKKIPPFEKKGFRKMLKFATSGLFLYKKALKGLFRQVDGVALGSPLGPLLANFFLGHLERYKFLSNETHNYSHIVLMHFMYKILHFPEFTYQPQIICALCS